ncbi:hypothetical protein, partial [Paracraurococcus lichenis]
MIEQQARGRPARGGILAPFLLATISKLYAVGNICIARYLVKYLKRGHFSYRLVGFPDIASVSRV